MFSRLCSHLWNRFPTRRKLVSAFFDATMLLPPLFSDSRHCQPALAGPFVFSQVSRPFLYQHDCHISPLSLSLVRSNHCSLFASRSLSTAHAVFSSSPLPRSIFLRAPFAYSLPICPLLFCPAALPYFPSPCLRGAMRLPKYFLRSARFGPANDTRGGALPT